MLSRAVPIAFSVVGALLLRRRGSGTERRGNERSAGELQATPPRLTRRPPARRLPSRDSGVRARAAALAALVSVLLSVALCWALLYSYTDVHLLQCLAGCNAACAASTAALLVSVSRKRRLTHGRPTTPGDESRRQALTTSELAVVLPRYNGFWRKDVEASESMDAAMDLIQLNWLLRRAVTVISGVELQLTLDTFVLVVRSHISWFKVAETYPLDGEPRRHQRRDMRGGGTLGRCTVTRAGVVLAMEWGEPFPGKETMLFAVSPDDKTLTVRSDVVLRDGRSVSYTTIYRKP